MVKWIFIGVLALPVAEIGIFILLAATIGLVWTLGLMAATTASGLLVLRWAGNGRLALFRTVTGRGISGFETEIEANPNGFLVILGGVLLVLPGFITDAVGVLLLLGPVRRWCGQAIRRTTAGREHARDAVINLAASEWQELPDRKLENPHGNSDRR